MVPLSGATFPILSRILLSRKPPEIQGNGQFSKRTMVGKNGESTLRLLVTRVPAKIDRRMYLVADSHGTPTGRRKGVLKEAALFAGECLRRS